MLNRRGFFATGVLSALAPSVVFSQDASPQDGHVTKINGIKQDGASFDKPYQIISKPIAEDKNIVRLLFAYDCPYCRSYHNGIQQWGKTLPSPIQFKATPIIASDSDNIIMAVYGRLLVESLAPEKVDAYDHAMYIQIQGDIDSGQVAKAKITPEEVFRTVVLSVGLPSDKVAAKLEQISSLIEKRIPSYAAIIEKYELKATPSVSIGGRIVVTPDHAGGSPQQYLLLLNALVSKLIQGGIDAI